jgi:hypothetical protein
MQNDAGECIYCVTFLTRENRFRSRSRPNQIRRAFAFAPAGVRRVSVAACVGRAAGKKTDRLAAAVVLNLLAEQVIRLARKRTAPGS